MPVAVKRLPLTQTCLASPAAGRDYARAMHAMARNLAATLRLLLGLAAVLLCFSTAAAQDADAELDELFAQLRAAPTEQAAHAIDQKIWMHWTTPSDSDLAMQMNEVLEARRYADLDGALRILNRMIAEHPDYAEGWNQRATIYYLLGNFEASIADCAEVLKREPRHFGALSGRALMYLQLGQRALALKDMATALKIHPFLMERHLFPELQQDMTRI